MRFPPPLFFAPPPPWRSLALVVCTAQPTSLAIWYRERSHRMPSSNENPNRRLFRIARFTFTFADTLHRRPALQDLRRSCCGVFQELLASYKGLSHP